MTQQSSTTPKAPSPAPFAFLTTTVRGETRVLPYRSRLADRLARPVAPFGWTVRPLRSALSWEVGPSWVFWLRDALSAVRSLRYITRDRSWHALYAGSVEIEDETVAYATQSFARHK